MIPRSPERRVGLVDLGRGEVALLGVLPFGRGEADDLERLAQWSEAFGTGELRLSPWRGFAIAGVAFDRADALKGLVEAAGLIADAADQRLAMAACPGLPACASATTPTRRDAARLAEVAGPLIAAGGTLHVSGCAKGCAQGKPASLTLVGDNGAYGVVLEGTSRDAPRQRLGLDVIAMRLGAVREAGDLAELFSGEAA
jgi:precorrin-3B synthase